MSTKKETPPTKATDKIEWIGNSKVHFSGEPGMIDLSKCSQAKLKILKNKYPYYFK